MSVFRVKLNNTAQGLMDLNPSTASQGDLGDQMSASLQRSVYVMGPNRINRLLADGETFTDCNYWKRFAYPQVALQDAIVEVVTDDGSVYSDVASENTFPVVENFAVLLNDTYEDQYLDILSDHGGYAVFTQITNQTSGEAIKVGLNGTVGDPAAIFDLAGGDTQIFNSGDLSIGLIAFDNSFSGADSTVNVQVLLSVRSSCNS